METRTARGGQESPSPVWHTVRISKIIKTENFQPQIRNINLEIFQAHLCKELQLNRKNMQWTNYLLHVHASDDIKISWS